VVYEIDALIPFDLAPRPLEQKPSKGAVVRVEEI